MLMRVRVLVLHADSDMPGADVFGGSRQYFQEALQGRWTLQGPHVVCTVGPSQLRKGVASLHRLGTSVEDLQTYSLCLQVQCLKALM